MPRRCAWRRRKRRLCTGRRSYKQRTCEARDRRRASRRRTTRRSCRPRSARSWCRTRRHSPPPRSQGRTRTLGTPSRPNERCARCGGRSGKHRDRRCLARQTSRSHSGHRRRRWRRALRVSCSPRTRCRRRRWHDRTRQASSRRRASWRGTRRIARSWTARRCTRPVPPLALAMPRPSLGTPRPAVRPTHRSSGRGPRTRRARAMRWSVLHRCMQEREGSAGRAPRGRGTRRVRGPSTTRAASQGKSQDL